jgi:hypothetical protein
MIDHDNEAKQIPYDSLKQAAMLLVKARAAEQRRSRTEAGLRRSLREAERLRSDARHILGLQPQ